MSKLLGVRWQCLVVCSVVLVLSACKKTTTREEEGGACSDTRNCNADLVCVENVCRRICYSDEDCDQIAQHCDAQGVCIPGTAFVCGNSRVQNDEQCDDGNSNDGDGCSASCIIESLWECRSEPSVCACVSNYQDNDADGECMPACSADAIYCYGRGDCDDANGLVHCQCDIGYDSSADCSRCDGSYQDNDHDGTCLPSCAGLGWTDCDGHGACNDGAGLPFCACDSGYQDNDRNGTCLPTCAELGWTSCGGHGACQDETGLALCACDSGYQDNDDNGTCLPTCATIPACVYGTCDDLDGQAECTCFAAIPYLHGTTCDQCRVYVSLESAAPTPDGVAWASAFPAVQPAVDAARAAVVGGASGGCEVWVAKGTYHVYKNGVQDSMQLQPHVAVYGGFAGVETSRDRRDVANNPTILDGSQEGVLAARVYHVVRGADFARLDGFHIRNGNAVGGGSNSYGGGVLVEGSSNVTIDNCVITDNSAQYGGGMANRQFQNVVVHNTLFGGNSGEGGALYNEAGTLSVSASVIANNMNTGVVNACTAPSSVCGTTRFENCLFVANESPYGGAIKSVDHTVELMNSTCVANRAAFVGGCVYLVGNYASVFLVNTIAWNNPEFGLFAEPGLTISASYGDTDGSVLIGDGNLSVDPKFVTVVNTPANQKWSRVTFYPDVNQTVLTDDDAAWTPRSLAGLYLQPDVVNRPSGQYPILTNDVTSITVNGDLIHWLDQAAYADPGDQYNIVDYHLAAGSPCIDKGTSTNAPTSDLEGVPRVCTATGLAGCPDMGAFER